MKLYLMKCGKYHKIGISKDTKARRTQLQTANPVRIELVCEIECMHFAEFFEAVLHTVFKDFKSSGEWFEVSEHSLHELITRFIGIDKAMSYITMLNEEYIDEDAILNYELFLEYRPK